MFKLINIALKTEDVYCNSKLVFDGVRNTQVDVPNRL